MRPRVVALVVAIVVVCAVLFAVSQDLSDDAETCFAADTTPTTVEIPCERP